MSPREVKNTQIKEEKKLQVSFVKVPLSTRVSQVFTYLKKFGWDIADGVEQGDQNAKGSALACAVRSEQTENLAGVDLKREVINGANLIVRLPEVGHVNSNRPRHQPHPPAPRRSASLN